MEYRLGVDLGSSFVAAAVERAGAVRMVNLGEHSFVVPSIVFVGDDGELVTGEAAERRALDDPARAVGEVRRRLGDPTPLLIAGRRYPATELLAALLRDAVRSVTEIEGRSPAGVLLTRPAAWGPGRCEQFAEVPRQLGLDAVLVTEPQAAAAHYAATRHVAGGETVAVYDLGGGSLDVAVLHVEPGSVEILGIPQGIERLGGTEFDQIVLDHVDDVLGGAVSRLDPTDPPAAEALARLRRDCVLAKEALSTEPETVVPVFLPHGHRSVPLTRDAFEKTIRPLAESTLDTLQRTVDSAGIAWSDLTAVLLTGGSSRIPLVVRTVADAVGRPVRTDAHVKHSVALGATLVAGPPDMPPAAVGARHGTAGSTVSPDVSRPGRSRRRPAAAPRRTAAVGTLALLLFALLLTLGPLRIRPDPDAVPPGIAAESIPPTTAPPGTTPPTGTARASVTLTPATAAPPRNAGPARPSAPPRTAPTARPSPSRPRSTTVVPRPPPASPPADLALGRPVAASGFIDVYRPANVTDGDTNTYWEGPSGAFPQWVQVDLGGTTALRRLVLALPAMADWNSRTQTLSVAGSADRSSWTTVTGPRPYVFDAVRGNTVTIPLPSTMCRYLRLTFTANSGWPAAQLAALHAYAR